MSHVQGPIEVIGCHAAGEIGDVIIGGVEPPPGNTVWEQSRWIDQDQTLRRFLLNEPRGGVFKHVNLLVPAKHPDADIGFIIMEPMFTPPMSGSNSICVATVVLELGIVEMVEPVTTVMLEAPAGLVEATAQCRDGKVEQVTVRNVAAFAAERDVQLDVPGIGTLRVDTAWGGDSFVMVDAADLGIELVPENGRALAELGQRIRTAANEQMQFEHPTLDWPDFSFCQIAGLLEALGDGEFAMRNTVVIDPGKLDRSPTGTGVSARLALLHAKGLASVGNVLRMRSIIDSEFVGQIETETTIGDHAAIVPLISGTAWRTGRYTYELDPSDPWPLGYRIGDTWPMN
jgi:proline racemase